MRILLLILVFGAQSCHLFLPVTPGIPASLRQVVPEDEEPDTDSLTIAWEPADNADIYFVYRSTDGSDGVFTYLGLSRLTTYIDTDVERDTDYWYKITAAHDRDISLESGFSDVLTIGLEPLPPGEPGWSGAQNRGNPVSMISFFTDKAGGIIYQASAGTDGESMIQAARLTDDEDWENMGAPFGVINGRGRNLLRITAVNGIPYLLFSNTDQTGKLSLYSGLVEETTDEDGEVERVFTWNQEGTTPGSSLLPLTTPVLTGDSAQLYAAGIINEAESTWASVPAPQGPYRVYTRSEAGVWSELPDTAGTAEWPGYKDPVTYGTVPEPVSGRRIDLQTVEGGMIGVWEVFAWKPDPEAAEAELIPDPENHKIVIHWYDGTGWSILGGLTGAGNFSCVAVSGTEIYLAYTDYTTADGEKVRVQRYDGSEWEPIGSPLPVRTQADPPGLHVDADGTVFLFYQDGDSRQGTVVKREPGLTEWVSLDLDEETVGITGSINVGSFQLFSTGGVLYAGYMEGGIARLRVYE